MDLEGRVAELERKVAELTSEAQAQQRFNMRMFQMLQEVRDDVAILRRHSVAIGQKIEDLDAHVVSIETRMVSIEARLTKLEAGQERLFAEFSALRRDLPAIVGDAVREALRESRA